MSTTNIAPINPIPSSAIIAIKAIAPTSTVNSSIPTQLNSITKSGTLNHAKGELSQDNVEQINSAIRTKNAVFIVSPPVKTCSAAQRMKRRTP